MEREPITNRDLPETLMSAMARHEIETYKAGEHRCCQGHPSPADMPLPSCFGACETHGPRTRAASVMLHHALAEFIEDVVAEAAGVVEEHARDAQYRPVAPSVDALVTEIAERIRDLARPCPKCGGTGFTDGRWVDAPPCDCPRGKAFAHWAKLNPPRGAAGVPGGEEGR